MPEAPKTEHEQRMPPMSDDKMPGGQAALPQGALPKPFLGPQGDENRSPPPGSPAPVNLTPVVDRQFPSGKGRPPGVVVPLADLPEGRIVGKQTGETPIVLVRLGRTVHAFGGKCPHAGAPLEDGAVCNGRLICPWHKAEFRIGDGAAMEPPALDDLIRYDAHVEGDAVHVSAEASASAPPPKRGPLNLNLVIIGSGAAATACVVELRRTGFDGNITLIGPEAAKPYDRTALSKFVLSGDMKPDEAPPLRDDDFWAANAVERLCASVIALDATTRHIRLDDGSSIAYDRALLATGAAAKQPSFPGSTLRGVHTLHDVGDAAAIVADAAPHAHAIIVGSGFIGLEAASALRQRGLAVTVVSQETVPFAKQFGPEIGGMVRRLHEANGVAFRLGCQVAEIEGTHRVAAVALQDGARLPADLVLVGTGVTPATVIVQGVSRAEDGGIVVDASQRAADGLYVAGDCATFPLHGRPVRIEHWRLAQQHGRVAAGAMLGDDVTYDGVPFFWTYHYGKRIESLGHATEWDRLHMEGDLDRQNFVAFQVKNDMVEGVVACQRERATAILIDRMRQPLTLHDALALLKGA